MKQLLLLVLLVSSAPAETFDVVVYGGTAGGVAAAVTAAREGLKVALLEPRNHLGGMVSGGLSWTDFGKKEVIGGFALEFYWRAGQHYEMRRYGNEVAWMHEPHVAENIFREMVKESGVRLYEKHPLRETGGVMKEGTSIKQITAANGAVFTAGVFIDSSYEGDLMAQSGVAYTWGRESTAEYGESLAGVRGKTPFHQFLVDVSAYSAQKKLLPEIYAGAPGQPGAADKKVQAYNYRMCFSEVPGNQVPFPKPAGYDPSRYELFARLLKARVAKEGRPPALNSVIKVDRIPNGKADINNQGAFSTDYIGGSWTYPEAKYAERERIWEAHRNYQQGFFYFLANDPQVPAELRREMNRWGLCKDEFVDTGNWPHQLYIREARRMVGEFVVTQKDLQTELTKPDAIGMGSYNSDSHNIQRLPTPDGNVLNEGDMQVSVTPYQIPYRVMLPKRQQATNLLVPVAFSASHVAYSSLRMEPQYMILGHAAGLAAKMALSNRTAVQEVDKADLQKLLQGQGAIFEYVPAPQLRSIQKFVARKKME
ncbi:MAG TPA: FAD-dependent oxidoreductase [Bryobacteraceae bacterium]|nr:FAD-dependent oxidoreductase [Bryobacteraceae bacterium]